MVSLSLAPDWVLDGVVGILAIPILFLIVVWGLVFYFQVLVEVVKGTLGYIITAIVFPIELFRLFIYPMVAGEKQGDR